MPRFVILTHDWPTPHFDLLLEADGVLKAWRLLGEPIGPVLAEANFDHRLIYLDYEGQLSGNRGNVKQWDAGTFDGEIGMQVNFSGKRLRGLWRWVAQDVHLLFEPVESAPPEKTRAGAT